MALKLEVRRATPSPGQYGPFLAGLVRCLQEKDSCPRCNGTGWHLVPVELGLSNPEPEKLFRDIADKLFVDLTSPLKE